MAAILLLTLLALEAVTRVWLVPASRDLGRFETYDERARSLAQAPAPRVALIGNSTTERAVDLELLRSDWQELAGEPLNVDMFVADASAVDSWYWMASRYFWKPEHKPDLLVVTYYGAGLSDANPLEVGRLAQYFTDPDDRGELFAHDLKTTAQRLDYLLSSVSQTIAARDRIRERTLKLIPGYEMFAIETNAINFEHERRQATQATAAPRTYEALHRFLARAQRMGTDTCFVAFPSRTKRPGAVPYEIDAGVLRAIEAAGMRHLDLRRMDGLLPGMYADDVHLTDDGMRVYTREFARALARIVTETSPPTD